MPIEIRPIQPKEIPAAKELILTVARSIFQWPETLEETRRRFEEQGVLKDVDELESYYLNDRGTFLVALDAGQVIGTGAIHALSPETAELKRLWLLEAYQGQGTGYQLVQELLGFARKTGYRRVRLLTDRRQARAMRFYQRVGFHPVPCETQDPDDACWEVEL